MQGEIMNDFTVRVSYMNKNMEKVNEHEYEFKQYLEMIKLELMRVIMDVQDSFISMNEGKPKEEWDTSILKQFQKIRHKLLDQANAIERMPDNLYLADVKCEPMKVSEFLADIFNNK